jgi:hypothetical protein
MDDSDLRSRFRRDFSEPVPTRPSAKYQAPRPVAPTAPVAPAPPTSPRPVLQQADPVPTPIYHKPMTPKLKPHAILRPAPSPPALAQTFTAARKTRKMRRKAFTTVLVALLIIGGASGYYLKKAKNHAPAVAHNTSIANTVSSQSNPLVPQISSNSATAVGAKQAAKSSIGNYLPLNLPSGYHINNDLQTTDNVSIYSVSDPQNNKYAITVEPTPSAADLAAFNKRFTGPQQLSVPAGSMTIGDDGDRLLASIQTDKKLFIVINGPSKNLKTQVETIAKSLKYLTN